jgi:Na+-transporting NADH:ubiquinone oxidoreductase subunit F
VPGGICTTYCFEYLKEGDEVKLNGPYGEFRLTETEAPIVFIAGGSGMAPIRCMLFHLRNTGSRRKAVYFFGANKVKEMFMVDEMRRFEAELPDFRFVPVIAQPDPDETWDGETGLVTQAVQRDLKDAPAHEAYLCGSPGMIDASIKVLQELGVEPSKIFFDKFA